MAPHTRAGSIAAASERYRDAFAQVDRLVRDTFPSARPSFDYGVPGWRVPRPPQAPRPEREGTLPSDHLYIGLAERKAGLTVTVWYPGDYYLFEKHGAPLSAAGYKVMRGCLAFNRKADLPIEPLATLLAHIKEADERGGSPPAPLRPPARKASAKKATKSADKAVTAKPASAQRKKASTRGQR